MTRELRWHSLQGAQTDRIRCLLRIRKRAGASAAYLLNEANLAPCGRDSAFVPSIEGDSRGCDRRTRLLVSSGACKQSPPQVGGSLSRALIAGRAHVEENDRMMRPRTFGG